MPNVGGKTKSITAALQPFIGKVTELPRMVISLATALSSVNYRGKL